MYINVLKMQGHLDSFITNTVERDSTRSITRLTTGFATAPAVYHKSRLFFPYPDYTGHEKSKSYIIIARQQAKCPYKCLIVHRHQPYFYTCQQYFFFIQKYFFVLYRHWYQRISNSLRPKPIMWCLYLCQSHKNS